MTVDAGIASLVRQSDYLRRSPASAGGRLGHKEWTHFCVLSDELDLLLNLSLMDHGHGDGGVPRAEVPRLTVLARSDASGWVGDVDTFAAGEIDVRGGRIDLDLGPNRLRFRRGAYELEAATASGELAASLRFEPLALPALTTSIGLSAGGYMKWLVVPRLAAHGEVRLGGRRIPLRDVPAYHDHDWGAFDWGDDFSWEWAVVLPPTLALPWSLVYMRISDRARVRVLSQGLLLWRGDAHFRTFRGRDVRVESVGFLRPPRPLRIPRVMALAAPGRALDVPRRLEARAVHGDDVLELALDLRDLAQVGIPDDTDCEGVTLLSEVRAAARVDGRVRGERLGFDGPAIVEFNHAAL